MVYNSREIEEKWQRKWREDKVFFTNLQEKNLKKKYVLAMFPYPSGSGLHIGHVRNYTVADIIARYYRLCGFNVFFPIGWDSFGLPAEQYAIQTGNHPAVFTQKNIVNFKKQLLSMGFSYDWSREINTSDPDYYRWTQWIFCQMYEKDLVKYQKYPVFWCSKLGTVLANEEILVNAEGQKVSERGNYPVIKKCIFQWVLEITKYAKELLEGLKKVDWPESIKTLQTNWIGLQEGFIIFFLVEGLNLEIPVFIQRLDLVSSASALGLSIDHKALKLIVTEEYLDCVKEFCDVQQKEKNTGQILGQFTGSYALNPINKERIPIFLINFVDNDYQTIFSKDPMKKIGFYQEAILISSFFSSREEWNLNLSNSASFFSLEEKQKNRKVDFAFIEQYLSNKKSVFIIKEKEICSYRDVFVFQEIKNRKEAFRLMFELLKKKLEPGKFLTVERYHLRDWVFCRQRYWGEPIPIVHFSNRKEILDCWKDLPLVLPFLQDFVPDGIHYAPLDKLKEWIVVKKGNSELGKRDANVMPQWAGSCWYYLGFLLKKIEKEGYFSLPDSTELLNYWLPVDVYIGGSEHANLHLLYARFWHKFLQKIGIVKSEEPFQQLLCQGVVLGTDGEKMSKSRGNVINPDSLIAENGADALRLYVIFLGPVSKTVKFDSSKVSHMKKWLNRVYNLFQKVEEYKKNGGVFNHEIKLFSFYKRMVSEVINFYQEKKFNLVISSLMTFINICYLSSIDTILVSFLLTFCQLLSPIAPHFSEELWRFWRNDYISGSVLDKTLLVADFSSYSRENLVIQVNGKKKAVVQFLRGIDFNDVKQVLRIYPQLKIFLENSKIIRTILVGDKLVNFVIQ